jgi:TolB protein
MLSGSGWQIFTINPDGTGPTRLTDLPTSQFHPAWSPDGTRIAFDARSAGGRSFHIYVMNADGSGLERLTDGPGWNYLPAWSPDGTRIAFVSNRDRNDEIYVMNADGSGQMRLTDDADEDLSPAWSPDGTRIAFQTNRDSNNEIYVIAPDGTNQMMLTDSKASFDGDPAWSPDGSRIAFVSDRDGQASLYVMNADGTGVTLLAPSTGYGDRSWSPDGGRIAFDQGGSPADIGGIYVVDVETRSVTKLFEGPVGELCCPAWQPVSVSIESPPAPQSPTPTENAGPANPQVAVTIPLTSIEEALVGQLAVGEGALWAGLWAQPHPYESSSVVHIDPATNTLVATIPIEGAPSDIAVGAGSVWVVGTVEGGGDIVSRIDPRTEKVVATITLEARHYGGPIAADADAVWVADVVWTDTAEGRDPTRSLLRIDPRTNEIVAAIPVEDRYADDIVLGEGGVWLVEEEGGDVVRLDPMTNQIVATIPAEAWSGLVVGAGAVWVDNRPPGLGPKEYSNDPRLLVGIDPETNQVVGEAIPLEGGRPDPLEAASTPIGADQDGVWLLGSDPNDEHVMISRLNLVTGEVDASIALPRHESQIYATDAVFDGGSDAIWVAYGDAITRVSLH